MSKPEKLLTTKEVAKILKTTPKTIQRLVSNGEFDFFRVGRQYRIPLKALILYIACNLNKCREDFGIPEDLWSDYDLNDISDFEDSTPLP